MRVWPDTVARLAFAALVLVLMAELAALFGWIPRPPEPIRWIVYLAAVLVFGFARFSRVYWRRIAMAYDDEFPLSAKARIAPGGAFEWHPEGEPRIQVRHGLVHRWWDAERGSRYDVRVRFDVPDDATPDELRAATKKGLGAAARALPARGKVRASAAHRDEPGPRATVSVRLAVQGIGADPAWAREAAEHFARAFLASLRREGHLADRRG